MVDLCSVGLLIPSAPGKTYYTHFSMDLPVHFFPMDLPVPGIFGNVVLQLFTDNSDFLVLGREPWERWESTAADVCLEKWRNWI